MKLNTSREMATAVAGLMGLAVMQAGAQDMRPIDAFGPEQGDWEMTLSAGGSNDRDFNAGGFNGAFSIGYFVTENVELAVRQGLMYFDSGTDSVWSGATRGAIDYHFNLKRLRPFIGVNFGGFYGDNTVDTWAAGLETGLKYYVKPETFLFVLGEYQWSFKDSDRFDNNFDDGQFLYSAGIGFNF